MTFETLVKVWLSCDNDMGTQTNLTKEERRLIFELSKRHPSDTYGHCTYCDDYIVLDYFDPRGMGMEVDHLVPYSIEPKKALANFYACCKRCNQIKKATHVAGSNSLKGMRYYINQERRRRGWYYVECEPETVMQWSH